MLYDKELEDKLSDMGFFLFDEKMQISVRKISDLMPLFHVLQNECAESTKAYSMDLNYDLLHICDLVYDESKQESVRYIAFRENGVDGTEFIKNRLCDFSPTIFSSPLYKSIWKITIEKTTVQPLVKLYKLYHH